MRRFERPAAAARAFVEDLHVHADDDHTHDLRRLVDPGFNRTRCNVRKRLALRLGGRQLGPGRRLRADIIRRVASLQIRCGDNRGRVVEIGGDVVDERIGFDKLPHLQGNKRRDAGREHRDEGQRRKASRREDRQEKHDHRSARGDHRRQRGLTDNRKTRPVVPQPEPRSGARQEYRQRRQKREN